MEKERYQEKICQLFTPYLPSTFMLALRSRGYRSFDELQNRSVAYGGKCIRGRMPDLPNHPLCEVSDMQVNKVRNMCWH